MSEGQAGPPASYETAYERLGQIINRLDSGEAELRETQELCAEAKGLVEYCAAELDAVTKGLEELNLSELVDRLSPREGSSPSATD
jgi:exodeoxyribonuclease VII small subunit